MNYLILKSVIPFFVLFIMGIVLFNILSRLLSVMSKNTIENLYVDNREELRRKRQKKAVTKIFVLLLFLTNFILWYVFNFDLINKVMNF